MKTVVARRGAAHPFVTELDRRPVGDGEVRIAVTAAAFTYFDAFVAANSAALGLPDQVGLGFDASGTVTETGAGVGHLRVGDRVVGLHTDITAPVRAHSEELVLAADAVATVPERLDPVTAAAVPLSALTARQALDLLGPDRGHLLVTGAAGDLGGWLVELARRDGWDVTALVRPGTEPLVAAKDVVTQLTGTDDVAYDAVVDAAALDEPARDMLRDGGRYVGFKPGRPLAPERGITVRTVQVQADGRALASLLPLAADGIVPVRIAGQAPLSDAPDVYARALTGSGSRGRWLLVP